MNCSPNSKIKFHDLSLGFLPDENKHIAIVRIATDKTLRVEQDVVQIFNILSYGNTIGQTAKLVGMKPEQIINLLRLFQYVGFIKEIDGSEVPDTIPRVNPWLLNTPRSYFKWIVKKHIIIPLIFIVLTGFALGVSMPMYYPYYRQFFWTQDPLKVLISIFIIDAVLVFMHELAHFTVTKAVGGEGSMSISYRAVYVVAETRSYYLALVPKVKRYLVYVAGMFWDSLTISIAYIILFLDLKEVITLSITTVNFLLLIILLQIKGIIWQLNVALKTDMYNLVSDILNHRHLRENTKNFLKFKMEVLTELYKTFSNPFNLYIPKFTTKLKYFRDEEVKQIKIYSKILIIGFIFVYAQFIFFIIPRDIELIRIATNDFIKSLRVNDIVGYSKAVGVYIMVALHYILLIMAIVKKRRKEEVIGTQSTATSTTSINFG